MKATSLFIALLALSISIQAQVPEGKTVISSLYVYDLASGQSNLVTRELRHFEAPNWSRDGKYF